VNDRIDSTFPFPPLLSPEELFRFTVESVKDYAILTANPDNRVVSWNPGAARIFGYDEAEIIGQSAAILFTPEDREQGEPEREFRTALVEGRAEDERWHIRKDGSRFWGSGVMTPLLDDQGNLRGFVKVARDMTEQKRLEIEREELLAREQQARRDAERANRLKDEFLATLSHELRHPLNNIIGYTYVLLRADEVKQSPIIRQAAETLHRNAVAQAQLINDLLDLSRLQTGKLAVNRQPVTLQPVLGEAVESLRAQATEKKVKLDADFTSEPLTVSADPLRLQQIVWNLVTNAIKFTPNGGRVLVSLSREVEEAKLVVADTGQGIDSAFLPHIFEMFRQAESGTTRTHGGMGIGLSLVNQLAEIHGGRAAAHSEGLGQGSQFTVWLPLQSATSIPSPQGVSAAAEGELAGAHILVVDDTLDTLEMMRILLTGEGAVVIAASSGTEGLRMAEHTQFDLVLSDISMPGMDGYEFLQNLRSQPLYRNIPAIAITGFGRESDAERARHAGYTTHVTKPIDFDHLVRLARVMLNK
jgi:two-component system, chemotaxis family, CheB/CheR fusion protein